MLGEKITYEIVVTNNGNLTLTNDVVKDEKTGDEWTIDSLAPGETSTVFTAEYIVTEEDILAGSVKNSVTATGNPPDEEIEDPKDDDEVEDPTEAMTKDDFTATSENYTNIKITVNPGTLTITPITDEYEIVVTGNSDTKVYNTQEQSVNGYTVSEYDSTITFTGLAQDAEKATAKGTNVGTYTMTMTKDDFTATSENYTNIGSDGSRLHSDIRKLQQHQGCSGGWLSGHHADH